MGEGPSIRHQQKSSLPSDQSGLHLHGKTARRVNAYPIREKISRVVVYRGLSSPLLLLLLEVSRYERIG